MVGSLEWKASDPNHKGRGAGRYWHRGKGVYSKYTGVVDSKRHAKMKRISDPRRREEMQMVQPHTHDYKPKIKMNRTTRTSYKGKPVNNIGTEEEVDTIMKKLKNTDSFFSDTYGLDDSLPEVIEPVVARETPLRSRRPFAPEGTRIRADNPQGNTIRINYDDNPSEVMTDLASVLEDVLVGADFMDSNNNMLNWKVKFATNFSTDANAVWIKSRGIIFLVLRISKYPSNVQNDNEQELLIKWVDVMSLGFASAEDGSNTNPTAFTNATFFATIRSMITETFSKGGRRISHSDVIPLSNAGIRTLEQKGIRIASVSTPKGREYYLITRNNYQKARQYYGKNLRFINSIPYYKEYRAEIKQDTITLYKGNIIKQKVTI